MVDIPCRSTPPLSANHLYPRKFCNLENLKDNTIIVLSKMELTKKAAIPKKKTWLSIFDDVSINIIASTATTCKILTKKIKVSKSSYKHQLTCNFGKKEQHIWLASWSVLIWIRSDPMCIPQTSNLVQLPL